MVEKTYNNRYFSPDYVRDNPVLLKIISLDKKFDDINGLELVRGSVKLRQTLCSEPYFIWGGFNASQLQFECYSDAFVNNPPEGKIRLIIIPTIYKNGIIQESLDSEAVNLFTGYIEIAEPTSIPNHWRVTAYDRLYRVRNNNIFDLLADFIHTMDGLHKNVSWYEMAGFIQVQLGLFYADGWQLPDTTKNYLYPTNQDVSTENGVDLLRNFALLSQRFGMLDGDGKLRYIQVQDSTTGSECYTIDNYDPEQFKFSAGHVWLPKFFTSEPKTNPFYKNSETSSEEDYYNNFYTVRDCPPLGNQEWINKLWLCDEYGAPSDIYSAVKIPGGIFDMKNMWLNNGEEYYQQEYSIRTYADPTIPMGSIIHIRKNGTVVVRSYIMQRTITFISNNLIQCDYSAENEPYNSIVPELEWGVRSANVLANQTSARLPFISDGTSLVKMRSIKCLSKTAYDALTEKRADTIYFVSE